MPRLIASLVCGLVFGAGLAIAGMTDPRKIAGFLDVTGTWDPSLMFTMAGALAVTFIAFPLIQRRGRPLFDDMLHLPTRRDIDPPLVFGSALFGIGWGLAGYCPGPAIASLSINPRDAGLLVVGMIGGMLAKRFVLDPWRIRRSHSPTAP
jgi:uncharacterized protein